ncbi:MAG: carboxypeptidase regulatory-like domain-containing protein [Acidobacteriota bacterium]
MIRSLYVFFVLFVVCTVARATDLATVRGIVHDPQHRPIAGATVTLQAAASAFHLQTVTNTRGEFTFAAAPLGDYTLTATAPGFSTSAERITLVSGTTPVLHIPLQVASESETVMVSAGGETEPAQETATPTTLITRQQIENTPGADRTLGMQMITDYVPGAYMTHDMLHVRGGHQTSWLIDGIAIPNTKIASNVGPQIDPKDISQVETQRGSYGADEGDRTYGIFDVVPRNGFDYDRQGELILTGGNFDFGEAQLSFGNHNASTAWYASGTGSRSNYGLQTPVAQVLHDATNSQSAFVSVLHNRGADDQLRLTAQMRQDYFQVPYDPNPNDWEQASGYYASYGLRDAQTERDSFAILNWVHTLSPSALFEVAPFYHFNLANYDARPTDTPVATTWHQSSNYAGMQADARGERGPNNFSGGLYWFVQTERDLYGLIDNSGGGASVAPSRAAQNAGLVEEHLSDTLRMGPYMRLIGGVRLSQYRAGRNENAVSPRIGATLLMPRLRWVLRGFYGRFFQPAPVLTVSSALLNAVHGQSGQNAFVPLHSESDEEHQFGLQIPWRGWTLDVDTFRNRVNNYLDHSNVGESNLFFPIGIQGALIRAWELSIQSPRVARFGQFHLAYSNQVAQQRGIVTGGFTCSYANDPACNLGPDYTPLDHDQRNTLNTGFNLQLPQHTWFATNVYYGSGFANGLAGTGVGPYNGEYLPVHTTFDASAGHNFGERWKLSVSALNVTNHRVLLDNSITIGGFHWNDPRMVSGELRYRFRF